MYLGANSHMLLTDPKVIVTDIFKIVLDDAQQPMNLLCVCAGNAMGKIILFLPQSLNLQLEKK